MAKPRYRQGQVVWARIADRSGVVKDQPRPVLITLVHPTNREAPLWGLAISTRRETDPSDPNIEMPWDATTGGPAGLFEWCAAVLLWFVPVEQHQIVNISGRVPDAFFKLVEQRVAEARSFEPKSHSRGASRRRRR